MIHDKKSLLDAHPTPFVSVDREFRTTFVSPAAQAQLGIDPQSILGRTIWEAFPGFENTDFAPNYKRSMVERTSTVTTGYYEEFGRWYQASAFPFDDGLGIAFMDITDIKRMEGQLRESEEQFRTLANSISQLAWMVDAEGDVVWYNDRWYDYTGTTLEQMRGWGWTGVHKPESLGPVVESWRKALQAGEPWEDTIQLRGKDGVYRWFLSIARPMRDAEGRIVRWFGTSTDVDTQMRIEADLRESRGRYETLIEMVPQLVWTCLPDGSCDYLSKQWVEYTGMNEKDQLGLHWLDRVIHPEDRERTLQHWMGAVELRHPYDIEYRIRRADGEYRWFKTRGSAMRDERGRVVRWFGTCTDIHDVRLLTDELGEAKGFAERASQAKSIFLANMSHEIRTPLGAIVGFAELLATAYPDNPVAQSHVERITRNSKQLARLIDELLDISKIEANRLEVERVPVDLNAAIADAFAAVAFQAREKGIQFEERRLTPIPDRVFTDPTRLRQILINLVGNAVKFTHEGKVSVDLKVESFADERLLVVRVSDTGIGLTPEQRDRLFEPFSQADSSITRRYGGTGLGLALSRELARLLGGDIKLEDSQPQTGSVFILTIALGPAANTPPADTAQVPPTREGRLTNRHILIVDDSPDNRMLVSLHLSRQGASFAMAADGAEALERIEQDKFDLVLMDLQMPRVDGYQAIRRLRDRGSRLPVIALTAHALKEERDKCLGAGFDGYVTKPIDAKLLIQSIVDLLA